MNSDEDDNVFSSNVAKVPTANKKQPNSNRSSPDQFNEGEKYDL